MIRQPFIDARTAVGVPCITTCPVVIPRGFLTDLNLHFADWQEQLLRAHGFRIADTDQH